MQGTVKWYRGDLGYGFVAPDDGGPDIYLHNAELARAGIYGLGGGDTVSFDLAISQHAGKRRAIHLRLIARGTPQRSAGRWA